MNTKQLLWLIIMVAVLVVLGVLIKQSQEHRQMAETADVGQPLLPEFPINSVETVQITDRDGTLELHKVDGLWRVAQREDYPANFENLGTFLRDLAELKATQVVAAGESQYGRLDLLPPEKKEKAGTDVVFKDKTGKVLATVRLGKEYRRAPDEPPDMNMPFMGGSYASGRYLLVPASKKVALVSKTFSTVNSKVTDWLDKEFIKIADLKTARLKADGNALWEASREKSGEDLKLAGPIGPNEEVDATKLRTVTNAFSWASFADVAGKQLKPEDSGLDKPRVFQATDFEGFDYTVMIGKLTPDQKYHVSVSMAFNGPRERLAEKDEKPEDKIQKDAEFKKKLEENQKQADSLKAKLEGWVYLVDKSTIDGINRERKDFLKEKEKPKAEATTEGVQPPGPPPLPEMAADPTDTDDPGDTAEPAGTDEPAAE